jgi:hypothetical protein
MKIDPKFYATVKDYDYAVSVNSPDKVTNDLGDFTGSIYRYLFHGLEPGGFLTSMLANDCMTALARSHPSNSLLELKDVSNWIVNFAPPESWGNYERVAAWCRLTDEQRRARLERYQLATTMWDILSTP